MRIDPLDQSTAYHLQSGVVLFLSALILIVLAMLWRTIVRFANDGTGQFGASSDERLM